MSKNFKIAVVMIGRNVEPFIDDTFKSIQNQTKQPDQIVYLDNHSTDSTMKIVESYRSVFHQLDIYRAEGGNLSSLRNEANRHVHCDVILVLDADDQLIDDAIENYTNAFANESVDLVYGDCRIKYPQKNLSYTNHYPALRNNAEFSRRILSSIRVPFKHSALAYRKESFCSIGGYNEAYPRKIDVYLFLKFLAMDKKVAKLNHCVAIHLKHSNQVSTKRLKMLPLGFKIVDEFEKIWFYRLYFKLKLLLASLLKLAVKG